MMTVPKCSRDLLGNISGVQFYHIDMPTGNKHWLL